ncbi:MAG: amidohydrolase family protein, partial [Haloglomus sp.]
RDLTAANPAEIFGLPTKGRIAEGMDADLVLFDPESSREIRGEDLHSKCGWTPFEGKRGVFPELTLVRGHVAYEAFGPDTAIEQAESGETQRERFGDAIGKNVRTIERDPDADDESAAEPAETENADGESAAEQPEDGGVQED